MVVEWDDDAVRVFTNNFVKGPIGADERPLIYHGDMAKVPPEMVLEQTGLDVGELDVLDGSPPCQGFSTAGSRVVEDERNTLFLHFARLIEGLRPRVFVMENVKGMVIGEMKSVFKKILQHLKAQGYDVRAKLLVASWLGTPQRRQRMIFIGVRNDLAGVVSPDSLYPNPWKFEPQTRHAIADLQDAIRCGPHCAPAGKTADIIPAIRPGRTGSDVLGTSGYGLIRTKWDRPSPTIVKLHNPRMYAGTLHPAENRYLGVNEVKRIGGFPDEFKFGCELPKWWEGMPIRLIKGDADNVAQRKQIVNVWARIGNAVPPTMMREIALSIRGGLDRMGV